MIHSYKYSDKWTKIGADVGICLGNRRGNFQLDVLIFIYTGSPHFSCLWGNSAFNQIKLKLASVYWLPT